MSAATHLANPFLYAFCMLFGTLSAGWLPAASLASQQKACRKAYRKAYNLYKEDGSDDKALIVENAINVWENNADETAVALLGTSSIPSIKAKSAFDILKELESL